MFRGFFFVLLGLLVALPLTAAAQEQNDSAANSQQETDTAAQSQGGSVTGSQQEADAKPVSFEKTDDIMTIVSNNLIQLQMDPDFADYRFAVGTADAPVNMGQTTSVDEYYVAFKQAFVDAVANLLIQDTHVSLSSQFSNEIGTNRGSDPSNADKCKSEYLAEERRREKAVQARARAQEKHDRSIAGAIERGARMIAGNNDENNEAPAADSASINKYVTCQVRFKAKELKLELRGAVSGGVFGVRVKETLNKNGVIAVIVARGPESARAAGELRGQREVAKPLGSARQEVIKRVTAVIDKYQQQTYLPPFGVIGIRAFRLSNDEMAYVGFGTAIQEESIDKFNAINNMNSVQEAQAKAGIALVEFAYMTADRKFEQDVDIALDQVLDETLDMAAQGKVVEVDRRIEEKLSVVVKTKLNAAAVGDLHSPLPVFTKAYSGGDNYPDFYLSAMAWSPSIMTSNRRGKDAADRAYDEGRKGGDKKGSGSPSSDEIHSYQLDEDW